MNGLDKVSKQFKLYNRALIPSVPPHIFEVPSKSDVKKLLWKRKALFARYVTDFHLTEVVDATGKYLNKPEEGIIDTIPSEWYYCIRELPISLESLTAKQRYRIKRGLNNNIIRKVSWEDIENRYDEFYEMLVASYSDFPDVYRPKMDKTVIRKDIKSICENENIDVWLCEEKSTNKIIGYSWCSISADMINLNVVKVNPAYLKNEINAALVFILCKHYLNDRHFKYISDGERNIRHQSNYQNFLVSVLGFRKAYCRLHVVYNPLVKPIVSVLYPFRKYIANFKDTSPFIYNIYCLLMQEQYARLSQIEM